MLRPLFKGRGAPLRPLFKGKGAPFKPTNLLESERMGREGGGSCMMGAAAACTVLLQSTTNSHSPACVQKVGRQPKVGVLEDHPACRQVDPGRQRGGGCEDADGA